MATESLQLTLVLPASPDVVYGAWLDSEKHALFTGGKASIDPRVGGGYTTWDGWCRGVTLEMEPARKVVQTWRTDEFGSQPDSHLEVLFEPEGDGTRLTLLHTDIPEGFVERYREGWDKNYVEPMTRFFAAPAPKAVRKPAAAAARKRPAKKAKKKPAARTAARRTAAKRVTKRATKKPARKRTIKKRTAGKTTRKAVRKSPARRTAARRKTAKKSPARKRSRR